MKFKRKVTLGIKIIFLLFALLLSAWAVKNLRFETRKKASEPVPVEEKEFSEIRPLGISQPIYEFTATGKLTLKKENSFFRIILIDKNQKEYLVYEAYPLIVDGQKISLNNACEETCVLEAIIPDKLRIEGLATDFEITQTSYEDKFQELPAKVQSLGIERSQAELEKEKESLKTQKLNEQIKAKGLKWIAGETSISKLSYEEKKKLFSKPDGTPVDKLPNLQGFEYYKGGIFEIAGGGNLTTPTPGTPTPSTKPSLLPASWDWRNVHGENWITSIKDQGQYGTCMIFSTVAALESLINLYKNEHINYDLSEQNLIDCCGQPSQCLHGTACCLSQGKIFEEFCDPYIGEKQSTCLTQCNNSVKYQFSDIFHYIWPLDTYTYYINSSDPYETPIREKMLYPSFGNIKKEIISKGPLILDLGYIYHSVLMVGYDSKNSDLNVIFKNSWGIDWGENGYGEYLYKPESLLYWSRGPLFVSLNGIIPLNSNEIKCVDKDNDKYCNWGISENKPETCSAFCRPEKDCDDSNPNLGPFDENLNCAPLNISPSPTPSCPQGEKGNLNCDIQGLINDFDRDILLEKWGPEEPFPTPNPGQWKADLNKDLMVNETDLSVLIGNWDPILDLCSPRNFKVAFILVARQASEVTETRLDNINNIKAGFPSHFLTATDKLAQADTSYPVVILVDDGTLTGAHPDAPGKYYAVISKVAQKFYESNNDQFHFLVIYTAFPTGQLQTLWQAQNKILGIGLPLSNSLSTYGSAGMLLGVNHQGFIDNFNSQEVFTYNGLLHETGHQWCCYLGEDFDPERFMEQSLPIRQQGIHFYRGLATFDPHSDAMDSDYWVPNGDGTFKREFDFSDVSSFHPITLYFMGLLTPNEITQTFPIYNCEVNPNWNFENATFARNVTIQDVVLFGGERRCINE